MDDSGSHNVELYIYDLTSGMAAMMSQLLLGRHIDGIWHTAVVVYGREFFFGGQGIQCCPPVILILVFLPFSSFYLKKNKMLKLNVENECTQFGISHIAHTS